MGFRSEILDFGDFNIQANGIMLCGMIVLIYSDQSALINNIWDIVWGGAVLATEYIQSEG